MATKIRTRRVILALIFVVTLASLSRVLLVARDQLSAPFDLTFETPNLCTVQSIQQGKHIYDPATYQDIPFILTIYTPAYHYLVSWLPKHPNNRFFTGRIVAMVFMILASGCLFFPQDLKKDLGFSILALACFFLIHDIVSHTVFLRNDSMALFFSAAAVVCAEKAIKRRWQIVTASILGFTAFVSKQSFLAATASCFVYLFLKDRRDALFFGLLSLFLCTAFLLFAQFHWGQGFWFSVFVAPRNPFILDNFIENWLHMLKQPVFVFMLLATSVTLSHLVIARKWNLILDGPYLIYLLLAAIVLLSTVGKEGGNVNYFFEPVLASLLWLVFYVKKAYPQNKPSLVLVMLVLVGLSASLEFAFAKRSDYSFTNPQRTSKMEKYIAHVKGEVFGLQPSSSKVLNLAWAGLTFELQDDPVMNDLYLYSILWNTGVLSHKPLMKRIVNQDFDVIVLREDQHHKRTCCAPYDYLIGSVLANYQLRKTGTYHYYTPRQMSSNGTDIT